MDSALNFNPFTVVGAAEKAGSGDPFGFFWKVGRAKDGDVGKLDVGSEGAIAANAANVDEGAGGERRDCIGRQSNVDAASMIVDEESREVMAETGIVVGDDGAEMDGVASGGFCSGEVVGGAGSRESRKSGGGRARAGITPREGGPGGLGQQGGDGNYPHPVNEFQG